MKKILYYFWIFVIGSFLGSIIETIWCIIRNKKIESRKSFVYTPMIPIYGLAAALIVFIATAINITKDMEIFIIGFVISSMVEYIMSFLQEKIFATKSWDYKNFPLNINGRINLLYSSMFGIVALIAYDAVLLPLTKFLENCELNTFSIILSILVFIFLLFDAIISFIACYRMKERKQNVKREGKFWYYIDTKYNDEKLKKVYANMSDA